MQKPMRTHRISASAAVLILSVAISARVSAAALAAGSRSIAFAGLRA